jgi:hypothetical protein
MVCSPEILNRKTSNYSKVSGFSSLGSWPSQDFPLKEENKDEIDETNSRNQKKLKATEKI